MTPAIVVRPLTRPSRKSPYAIRTVTRGSPRASDIGARLDRGDQALDGAVEEIDERTHDHRNADQHRAEHDADCEQDQPDPEGVDRVLEMAVPRRADAVVALDIGQDDAGQPRRAAGEECAEIESI